MVITMKSEFESQRNIKKASNMREHHSLASISSQYLETTRLLIQTFDKILSKYFAVPEKDPLLVERLFEKIVCLFRLGDKNVFNDVTKVVGNCLKISSLGTKKKYIILDEVCVIRSAFGSEGTPNKSSQSTSS